VIRPFGGRGSVLDWLIVGLGNPGREYAGTRHNVGFAVADLLAERWDLPTPKQRFQGRIAEGRARSSAPAVGAPSPPRVAMLWPQTYMNEAGRSVGPARGSYKLPLNRVLAIHDEIDLPFGEIRVRLGGGLAGHNGLKSLKRELGSADFWRVRVGVGRPDSTDPEIVSAHVLGGFREPAAEVAELVERAADETERKVLERDEGETRGEGETGSETGMRGEAETKRDGEG
jgi:PTH1 family peptidyl-tRNA hydrolase